jgi:hypothetical protein
LIPTVALGKLPKATVKLQVKMLHALWEPEESYEWTTTDKPLVELAKEAVAKYRNAQEIFMYNGSKLFCAFDRKFIGGYYIWYGNHLEGNKWSPTKHYNYDDPNYEMFREFPPCP